MKRLFILLLLQFTSFYISTQGQNQSEIDKGWKWIIPLKTQKAEIEKAFGESITKDKSSFSQTYLTDFGKINVSYTKEEEFIKECSCKVNAGVVLDFYISPYRFKLSELNFDLSKFKKDDTYSPRELSYFSEEKGILIATEIVELEDKSKVERVFALEYRPVPKAGQIRTIDPNRGGNEKPWTDEEIKSETDFLLIRLNQDANLRGFIIDYGNDKEVAKRKAKILKHIKYRRFPLSRIEFIRGSNKSGIRTEFEVRLAGSDPPTPK